MKSTYFDLTRVISEQTAVYPGDPCFRREQISSINPTTRGMFNLYHMHMGNHMGTHIDYPSHVLTGGKTSSDYSASDLIGDGCIIEVPAGTTKITGEMILANPILPGDIVFFKTDNSKINETAPLAEKYVYLDITAAEKLVEKGVRIVGIDYISIDSPHAEDLPVHHYLLSRNVLIVEGLKLEGMRAGRGEMIIAPLNISNIDGAPARVLMRKD